MGRSVFCVKCGRELSCKKTGAIVKYGDTEVLFRADVFECVTCGYEVVHGLGNAPMMYYGSEGYEEEAAKAVTWIR